VGSYLHGTRIGVLVELEGGTPELARDLAMQVASLSPRYVAGEDVPKELLEKEREIILAQTAEEKKPPEIIAKMVEGRLRKVVDEITLTGQVFVKDDKKKVRDLLAAAKRDPATFHFAKRVYMAVDNDEARGERRIREWFGRRYKNADLGPKVSIWGSAAKCTEKIQEIVKAGAQQIVFNPMFDETEHLEICAKEIMPHL